jgi:hypothetical protein
MPVNKNAVIRYRIIDNCLRNRARKWTWKDILDEVNKELNQYELGQVIDVEEPTYNFDNEEEEDTMLPGKSETEAPQQQASVDYSELTQRELQELIDDALDKKDYKRVEMLAQYMKEGKEIYLKELERINEGHNFHTRRK